MSTRFNPMLGFALLIAVAIAVLLFTAHPRPGSSPAPDTGESQTSSNGADANKSASATPAPQNEAARLAEFDKFKAGAVRATLVVEKRGTMVLELYPQAAPKTVAHFVDLCKRHFYDGIKFHRVDVGFVAQAGDPVSKGLSPDQFTAQGIGQHGSGQTVPLEVKLPHVVGSIGEARTNDPDSGDSQFYINLKDNAELDSGYCVFGRIVQGGDIPPKIQIGDVIKSLTVP